MEKESDVWIGEECLTTLFPNLFNCSINKEGYVADFHSNSGWQLESEGT